MVQIRFFLNFKEFFVIRNQSITDLSFFLETNYSNIDYKG